VWVCLVLPVPNLAAAGALEGLVGVEMEYLGEAYFREQTLTSDALNLPGATPLLLTTRVADDTWLPGQRLELRWRSPLPSGSSWTVGSRTMLNSQRLGQDLELLGDLRGEGESRWRLRLLASLREETRSLVGHGDWRILAEVDRNARLGPGQAGVTLAVEHSRTRGDTLSYLYDYSLLRGSLRYTLGGGWVPAWELRLGGLSKTVPRGQPGGFGEIVVGAAWRPRSGESREVNAEVRGRDYAWDGAVGRDGASFELAWRERLGGGPGVQLLASWMRSVYAQSDDLYFDADEIRVSALVEPVRGQWSMEAGPQARWLQDRQEGGRGFRQLGGRVGVNGFWGMGGFADLGLEAGYRDYGALESDRVTVEELSSTILRSDAWMLDLLLVGQAPIWANLSLDVMATASWELHQREGERIQIALATLGLSRNF
jgi:hypothetical protein